MHDLEQIREWRNEQIPILRTPFPLTKAQQIRFYQDIICNRQANARYWGIWRDCEDQQPEEECLHLIGMAGMENIQWENRLAEISIILDPNKTEYWFEALTMVLQQGFMMLNLENLFTEVYDCSPLKMLWEKAVHEYDCVTARLPARKYYDGNYYSSTYINFNKGAF